MKNVLRNLHAILLGAVVFVSCSQPANVQNAANVVVPPLKNRIPPPDPNRYGSVRDASDWQNPYLIVQANGIDARPNGTATKAVRMAPTDVVAYLEKLPSTDWPYGLIVVVTENGLRNPGDDVPIKRNREELVSLLEKAGIKVDGWPSA